MFRIIPQTKEGENDLIYICMFFFYLLTISADHVMVW